MSIMSCYTGFFNMRRGWQSLNTGPRFYLRLIRRTGWLWICTSRTTDGCPFKPKKLSVPFLYLGVPAGLAPFRGLVPLGRRNLVPTLPPAHPLGGGQNSLKIPNQQVVNQRRPDNTMIKRKKTKRHTMVHKTLHRILKVKQHEPHQKWAELRCSWRVTRENEIY